MARGVSDTVLLYVVLTSGALFGAAALALLQQFGLDLPSIRIDLLTRQGAMLRPSLAWWAWWLVAGLAFVIGRSSARLARMLAANGWRPGGLRLLCTTAVVLALAAAGDLPAAPTGVTVTSQALFGAGVLMLSTLLVAIGARSALRTRRTSVPAPQASLGGGRAWSPIRSVRPARHGGSINEGLPSLAMRHDDLPAGASMDSGRRALAAAAIVIAVSGISALGSAAVVLNLSGPEAIRGPVGSAAAAAQGDRAPPQSRPAGGGAAIGELTRIAVPGDLPIPLPPPRPSAAVLQTTAVAPADDSELTFAKGYARRRAMIAAAGTPPAQDSTEGIAGTGRAGVAPSRATPRNRLNPPRRYDLYGFAAGE